MLSQPSREKVCLGKEKAENKNYRSPRGADYIILNSVALYERIKPVFGNTHYLSVYLYLDSDKAGDEATTKIQTLLSGTNISIKDKRTLYPGYKDFNEYLCSL